MAPNFIAIIIQPHGVRSPLEADLSRIDSSEQRHGQELLDIKNHAACLCKTLFLLRGGPGSRSSSPVQLF